jgi:hypothetical protein
MRFTGLLHALVIWGLHMAAVPQQLLDWGQEVLFLLILCPVLQEAGGATGDHEAERAGERPLAVPALWGGAGLPGQLVGVLQRLPKGKACSGPAIAAPQPGLALWLHGFASWLPEVCVCLYVHVACVFVHTHEIFCFLERRIRA